MSDRNIFVWQGNWHGGAGRITLELARYLQTRKHDVTLGVYKKDSSVKNTQLEFKIPGFVPPLFKSLYASIIFRRRYADNFGSVYTHTLGIWKTSKNYLFVHDAAVLDATAGIHYRTAGHKLAFVLWRYLYLYLTLKKAKVIFSANSAFKQYLLRRNISADKIIDSGSFYNERVFMFKKREVNPEITKLIYIGDDQDEAKNFSFMKKMFYRNKNYTVSVFGGQQKYRDNNFYYGGYLNPKSLCEELNRSDLFIMPSISEGFSIALLEALATGLPCLVNNAVIPAALKDIKNLIAFQLSDDIHEIIKAIIQEYGRYNLHDANLDKFTRSNILMREYVELRSYLS